MEQHIIQRWNNDKLEAIASRFGTTQKQMNAELDGSMSFIYEYKHEGQGRILRIGHSQRRNLELIHGEVDWLNFLAAGGARVAQAIQSEHGNLVEFLDDGHGDYFLATAFVKAEGDHLSDSLWTSEFVRHYGETIGHIHRLSKNYVPSNPAWMRYHWNDPISFNVADWDTLAEAPILSIARDVTQRLFALPQDESYHMIHQDAHGGNFFVDDKGQITLFDFDECAYGHEIYDIAMVLFYSPIRNNPALAEVFTRDFLTGYTRENKLDPKWLAHIADFMKLREIDLYVMITRDLDWRNGEDLWARDFMQGRQERLLKNVPLVDFDFTSLASLLL